MAETDVNEIPCVDMDAIWRSIGFKDDDAEIWCQYIRPA